MADIGVPLGIGSVFPLPRSNVGRRIEDWISGVVEATRTRLQSRSEPKKKEYHHPRREVFLEDAAMSREMFRL